MISHLYTENNLLDARLQRAYVLHSGSFPQSYTSTLSNISRNIKVIPIAYNQSRVGTVAIDPAHGLWSSREHGVVKFK